MRPIPVAFHVWFIEIHTYGIGLALTFWFGLRYTERRLRKAGHRWQWVTGMFLWVIVAAIVGARALHVISNLSYYSSHPGQVVAIWQGGLSSFGGLLFAVPVAIISQRRRCPELPTLRFADLMAPVLMASWGIGRLLGPQLMVAGGGHPTHQWFGMYYADQVGKRLPVPIFQAMEDFAIFAVLLLVERWLRRIAPSPAGDDATAVLTTLPAYRSADVGGSAAAEARADDPTGPASTVAVDAGDHEDPPAEEHADLAEEDVGTGRRGRPGTTVVRPPAGIVLGVGMVMWGIERYLDEHLWLGEDGHLGSLLVQWAGGLLALAGVVLLLTRVGPLRRWRQGELVEDPADPARVDLDADVDADADGADAEAGSDGGAPLDGRRPVAERVRASAGRPGSGIDPA